MEKIHLPKRHAQKPVPVEGTCPLRRNISRKRASQSTSRRAPLAIMKLNSNTYAHIFEVIAGKTRGSPGGSNPVTSCLICCLRCCISCLDRVIRYINRNAYIQIALTSESFCPSALNAFMLILKNASKFAFLGGIGNVFAFLGKMCIASITTGIAFILIKNWDIVDDHVESPITPLILVFLLAYTIGSIFVSVFTISANAIMQCFLVDLEISGERGALRNRPATLERYTHLAKKQEDGKHANGLN